MSFREVRNFLEILRTLGYRRSLSLESFRKPNFHLIADILVWLVKRFDSEYNISNDTSTSEQRVLLIRSVTEFMLLKANLKLNMKKLYQADGHAVKEMLKIASLLHEALKIELNVDENVQFSDVDLSAKIQELKLTRELALQITHGGSSLYELLGKEPSLRKYRIAQANTYLDINDIEAFVKNAANETDQSITQVKQQIESIASIESNLDAKISKKENDLERIGKRLETLKSVKPAFLEEYERYENELNQIYENYVLKFRCYTYLQQQLQQLLSNNQAVVVNNDSIEFEDNTDKIQSLIEDASLSSSSPPADDKLVDATVPPKKSFSRRIRTATDSRIPRVGNHMYSNAIDDGEDLNGDDDDDDDDDEDDLLDDELSLSNDVDSDDSDFQPTDTENYKANEDENDKF